MVEKVSVVHVSLRVFQLSLVNIILPTFHINFCLLREGQMGDTLTPSKKRNALSEIGVLDKNCLIVSRFCTVSQGVSRQSVAM